MSANKFTRRRRGLSLRLNAFLDIFNAARTVPVKFELKYADGSVVLANRPPVWETPTKGGPITGPAPEAQDGDPADTDTGFRTEGKKYQCKWAMPKSGRSFSHGVGVRLDDGQTHYVNIGLR